MTNFYHHLIFNLGVLNSKLDDSSFVYQCVSLRSLLTKVLNFPIEDLKFDEPEESFRPLYGKPWKVCSYPLGLDTAEDLVGLGEMCLPVDFIEIAINGRGKFDIYFVSYLCQKLNCEVLEEGKQVIPWVFNTEFLRSAEYTNNFAKVAVDHARRVRRYPGFTEAIFDEHKKNLAEFKDAGKIIGEMKQIQNDMKEIMSKSTAVDLSRLENYLVSAIGCENPTISKNASNVLGCLKSGQDWMKRGPIDAKVQQVGEQLAIELIVEKNKLSNRDLIIMATVPSAEYDNHQTNLMYINPRIISIESETFLGGKVEKLKTEAKEMLNKVTVISHNLDRPKKAGFYTWRLVKVERDGWVSVMSTGIDSAPTQKSKTKPTRTDSGKMTADASSGNLYAMTRTGSARNLTGLATNVAEPIYQSTPALETKANLLQGTFLVHPKDCKSIMPHEISLALQGDSPHFRGFDDVKRKLENYQSRGINTIYINGVNERANNHFSPKSRVAIATKLGGLSGLQSLIKEAHTLNMKIIVDFSYRISSLSPDKRYLDQMCYVIEDERKMPFYGAPGRSMNPDDSFVPNMRDYNSWRYFIEDIKTFVCQTGVDGLLFDNADSLPLYFKPNRAELNRTDYTGEQAYTDQDRY